MSTKHTHTPGPWDDASQYPEYQSIRIFAGTHYIATVGNSDDSKEQTQANARLIAAAPGLVAALEAVTKDMNEHGVLWTSTKRQVDAALAKARGEGREG